MKVAQSEGVLLERNFEAFKMDKARFLMRITL